jgi:hypothetical protein
MNYASEYREKLRKRKQLDLPYSRYVDLKTMHFIVHSRFYGGRADWDVVGFEEDGTKKLAAF